MPNSTLSPLQSLIARRWRPQWVCRTCQHRQQLQWRGIATTTPATTPAENSKPFYATTPIFYVNAAPHVGHMYTMLLADVLKRWQALRGRKSILCTGTDEHGMKIQQAAAKAGIEPNEFCNNGAETFKTLAENIGLANDIFIRTTDKKHREAVEYAWIVLQEKGWIYESRHEGWYSVSDETFVPENQVHLIVDPPTGRRIKASIETGKEVEWTSERNYHFRLSAFREKLLEFYAQNPSFVVPQTRMNDIVQQVTSGLEDLSVSRPTERLTWGIPVPTDASQTIYVWLDALLNYASAAGYPFVPGSETAGGWPADVHVVGKDIIRFHCIYWPAFLMALDLPLPKQVLTHAHWTIGRQKMAKSTGNVVNPFWAMDRFGTDAMRWYLVHEGALADDPEYDNSFIVDKYKKGLKGGLGNLTHRIMRGKGWSLRSAVERYTRASDGSVTSELFSHRSAHVKLIQNAHEDLRASPADVEAQMHALQPNLALRAAMKIVADANVFFSNGAPWELATRYSDLRKEGNTEESDEMRALREDIERVVYLSGESLRLVGIMLQAFIPVKAAELLDKIGVRKDRRGWEWCVVGADEAYGRPLESEAALEPLFPRLTCED